MVRQLYVVLTVKTSTYPHSKFYCFICMSQQLVENHPVGCTMALRGNKWYHKSLANVWLNTAGISCILISSFSFGNFASKQNDLFSQFKQTVSTHKGLEKRRKWKQITQSNFWSQTFRLLWSWIRYGHVFWQEVSPLLAPKLNTAIKISWMLHVCLEDTVCQSYSYYKWEDYVQSDPRACKIDHLELCCAVQ